ncbi:MAG: hypothetical protein IK999_08630 [Ruminococcus sp.]|nr:hypothetical protein [Ruminococcus sp.]
MFTIRNEVDERVMTAVEDIKAGCEVMDDYHEWDDIASSSISSMLEDLDDEQFDSTCAAFIRYIMETVNEHKNLAYGVRAALIRAMNENIDYIDGIGNDGDDPIIPIMRDVIDRADGLFEEETA